MSIRLNNFKKTFTGYNQHCNLTFSFILLKGLGNLHQNNPAFNYMYEQNINSGESEQF